MSAAESEKVDKSTNPLTSPGHEETQQQPPPPPATEELAAAKEAKTRPERTPAFKDYVRVFSYATKWDLATYAVGVITSIGAGVTLPLMNVVFGQLAGKFTDYFMPNHTMTRKEFEHQIDKLALYIFALFISRLFLSATNKFVFKMVGIKLSSAIRLHYLKSLFGQSIHVLDSMPPGYATGTITSTANTLQLGISEKLATYIEFNTTIVAALIVAFTWNWLLTLVTASVILYLICVLSACLPFIIKGQTRLTKAEGKANAVASEAFASIRMIAACGAETRVGKKFATFVQETKKHGQWTSPIMALQLGLAFFGLYGSFGLSFWFGTKAFQEGRVDSISEVLIVLMSVMITVISLERTSTPMIAISKAMVAACEFFTVIDAPQPDRGHLKAPEVSSTDDIVFEKVTFAYPSRPHVKVLDDLDLRIEAGKINAVVGPSGSGKSTIVGLIQRWYSLQDQAIIAKTVGKQDQAIIAKAIEKPKGDGKKTSKKEKAEEEALQQPAQEDTGPPVELRGCVSTSGHSLDEIDLKWWRSQIGLVQQEPFLFNDSIFANVAHGLVGSAWEDEPEEKKRELVREACKEAFADEFIDKLPEGYDTKVGDSGAKLSGGQRQRIAIARSIVRKPQILILDEATSAIDVRGERIVQAALDRVAQHRTTITIAHRLSTIKKADRITVLKKGRVVESGTHESLIAIEGGIYSGLVHAQTLSLGESAEAHDCSIESDSSHAIAREKSHAASEHAVESERAGERQRGLFTSFGRLFYESRFTWPICVGAVLFAACVGAAMPLQAWLFSKVINIFLYADDEGKMRSESNFWSLMWMVLAIGVGLSYFGLIFLSTQLSSLIRAKYSQQYFEAVLFQKASFFDEEDHSQGTMTSRVGGDPKQLEELMGMNMSSFLTAIFNVTGTVSIAFAFGWKLALVACCVVLPVLILSTAWRFKYDMQFEKMNNAVFAESSQFASEAIGAFRTVSALTLEDSICLRYENLLNGHVLTAYKKARWVCLIFGFSDSISMACQALIFYYGGRLLASREYALINFFVCLMAVMNGGEAAGSALGFAPNAAQVTAASNRILNMRESKVTDDVSASLDIPGSQGGLKIELQNLRFRYPTRNLPVFKGLSLTIEKGQFAALVGASGCGKTSIISLLERFYDLDGGRILCNGLDIHDMNVFAYRKHLSLVAQESSLFQGTIRENILLGVDPSAVSDEQLHQVCRDASIHDFIISLPEGYNTNIGSRGVSLSGGQKQRVAIARALIREPSVLLLDEATSSLDSESEKLVQAAFERAGKGRTMVVVAHRLATVQNADVIFVLGDGQLLEQGNHTELLKRRGVYWNMCQSQALDR